MSKSAILTDSDRLLIDALQIAPRASWSAVGDAVGITAVTAARRWRRLTESGIAWVTVAPGMTYRNAQCLAYVEITCQPAHRLQVAQEVATHHPAISVELTSGGADILVTVAAADLTTMSHYLLEHLGQVKHVLTTRARLATRLYAEGSVWRLGELSRPAVISLERIREEHTAKPTGDLPGTTTDSIKALLTHLSLDGRASYAELADRTRTSPTTVRRQVDHLLRSGVVIPRTDVSAQLCGWPVQAYLWADAPVDARTDAARELSRLRQARLCATITSGASLMLGTWLRTVEEVHRLELAIATKLPQVQVVDRLIVLRSVKRMGRLLDESGRAVGHVPVNIWDDLLDHEHDGLPAGSLPAPAGPEVRIRTSGDTERAQGWCHRGFAAA